MICTIHFVGFGVFATKEVFKGNFLLVYRGELIDEKEALMREDDYSKINPGCFVYQFQHHNKTFL